MPTRNDKSRAHFSENQNLNGPKIPKVSDRKRKCKNIKWIRLGRIIKDHHRSDQSISDFPRTVQL